MRCCPGSYSSSSRVERPPVYICWAQRANDRSIALGRRLAQQFCFCITLNRDTLHAAMEREAGDPEFSSRYIRPREHLFSNVPVFLAAGDLERMTAVVQMVEAAARLPRYRETVLAWAPMIARFDPGPRGAFMGYDFHFGAGGPKLIEVNTLAGASAMDLLGFAQHAWSSNHHLHIVTASVGAPRIHALALMSASAQ